MPAPATATTSATEVSCALNPPAASTRPSAMATAGSWTGAGSGRVATIRSRTDTGRGVAAVVVDAFVARANVAVAAGFDCAPQPASRPTSSSPARDVACVGERRMRAYDRTSGGS